MKKNDIALIIGVVVVVIVGICLMGTSQAQTDYELPLTLEGEPGLTKLSYDEYSQKIDNGDAFVVIVERADCSHCINYMPVAEEFAETNNVPMYYIDTDGNLSDTLTFTLIVQSSSKISPYYFIAGGAAVVVIVIGVVIGVVVKKSKMRI